MHKGRVIGKIYFTGKIKIMDNSFLSISSGISDEKSDSAVYRDTNGRIIIPATSFAGVFRSMFEKLTNETATANLFGNKEGVSKIVFFDLYSDGNNETHIQHRTAIDREKLSTKKGAKFDKEILLDREFEVFFYIEKERGVDDEVYLGYIDTIKYILNNKVPFFIGGDNTIGNGWVNFKEIRIINYDFTDFGRLKDFLLRDKSEQELIKTQEANITNDVVKDIGKLPQYLKIEYNLSFKDFVLTNDAEADTDENDFNFLKINGKELIQGASIKGVIRNRAEMISKTEGIEIDIKKIDDLFGSKNYKSNIFFSNAVIQDNAKNKKLDGVSIDRFTGGAVEKAKFDFIVLSKAKFKGEIIIFLDKLDIAILGLLYLIFRDIKKQDISFGYGRTKGWGVASEFNYKIIEKQVSEIYDRYFSDNTFDVDEIEKEYVKLIGGKNE